MMVYSENTEVPLEDEDEDAAFYVVSILEEFKEIWALSLPTVHLDYEVLSSLTFDFQMLTYLLHNLPHVVGVAMVGYLGNTNALAGIAIGTLVLFANDKCQRSSCAYFCSVD
jgi:hypothetical protein